MCVCVNFDYFSDVDILLQHDLTSCNLNFFFLVGYFFKIYFKIFMASAIFNFKCQQTIHSFLVSI